MYHELRKGAPVCPPAATTARGLIQADDCGSNNDMSDHEHDHGHGSELSEMQLRVRALETILVEKGYVDPAALDAIIETFEHRIGPHNGSRAIAKAWVDPAFHRQLLDNAAKAFAALGVPGGTEHLIALENTPQRHNMVVCTL